MCCASPNLKEAHLCAQRMAQHIGIEALEHDADLRSPFEAHALGRSTNARVTDDTPANLLC